MIWLIEKYVLYVIGFVLLWVILWAQGHYSCKKCYDERMTPTIAMDEFLLLYPKETHPNQLKEDDLVYFHVHSNDAEPYYVGRVIALPGQRLAIKRGHVIVEGHEKSEVGIYIDEKQISHETMEEIVIPRDHVFLLCDNRKMAPRDSRRYGPLHYRALLGKVKP